MIKPPSFHTALIGLPQGGLTDEQQAAAHQKFFASDNAPTDSLYTGVGGVAFKEIQGGMLVQEGDEDGFQQGV